MQYVIPPIKKIYWTPKNTPPPKFFFIRYRRQSVLKHCTKLTLSALYKKWSVYCTRCADCFVQVYSVYYTGCLNYLFYIKVCVFMCVMYKVCSAYYTVSQPEKYSVNNDDFNNK